MTLEESILREALRDMDPEEIALRIEGLENALHDCKQVANNAAIRLPDALENIEFGMRLVNKLDIPSGAIKPLAKAFEAITLTLYDMKNTVEPIEGAER